MKSSMQQPRLKGLFQTLDTNCMLGDDNELARLLTGLRNPNGIWKKTRVGRHSIANKFLIDQLSARSCEVQRLFDVGVSSGITTAELISDLENSGIAPPEIYAVDRCFDVYLVCLSQGFYALVEGDGHILRLEYGPLNFSPWCSKTDWATGTALVKIILRSSAIKRLKRMYIPFSSLKNGNVRRLKMLSPSLYKRSKVKIMEHDLFHEFESSLHGCASLARIANVLNTNLLTVSQIQRIAKNVGNLCHENAFLYVCRSTKIATKASLFMIKGQFEK